MYNTEYIISFVIYNLGQSAYSLLGMLMSIIEYLVNCQWFVRCQQSILILLLILIPLHKMFFYVLLYLASFPDSRKEYLLKKGNEVKVLE